MLDNESSGLDESLNDSGQFFGSDGSFLTPGWCQSCGIQIECMYTTCPPCCALWTGSPSAPPWWSTLDSPPPDFPLPTAAPNDLREGSRYTMTPRASSTIAGGTQPLTQGAVDSMNHDAASMNNDIVTAYAEDIYTPGDRSRKKVAEGAAAGMRSQRKLRAKVQSQGQATGTTAAPRLVKRADCPEERPPEREIGGHPCEYENCTKTYDTRSKLNKHRKCHLPPKERPFGCLQCDKKFYLPKDLKRHAKVHLEYRIPFLCTIKPCKSRGFAREDGLYKHMRERHPGEVPAAPAT
ncbi:hypothetical protein BJ546DRAFT_968302 [Cryomyces antarcticus]